VTYNYLRNNSIPTDTEDNVQDWFNKLMGSLPNFIKRLVKDIYTNTYFNRLKLNIRVIKDDARGDVYLTMFMKMLLEAKKKKYN
jgi:hypothetical protein